MKVEVLCAVCRNSMQVRCSIYADGAVLTVQCSAQNFSSCVREPKKSYADFIISRCFFWIFVFMINQINTVRGLCNEVKW